MSIDPRKGRAVTRKRSTDKLGRKAVSFGLDQAFDLFFSAKRAEGVRERMLSDYENYWRYFHDWLVVSHPEIDEVGKLDTAVMRAYINYMSYDRTKYDGVEHRRMEGYTVSPVTVAYRLRALQTICKFWTSENLLDSSRYRQEGYARITRTGSVITSVRMTYSTVAISLRYSGLWHTLILRARKGTSKSTRGLCATVTRSIRRSHYCIFHNFCLFIYRLSFVIDFLNPSYKRGRGTTPDELRAWGA
jgi:hypothetical protein